MLVLFRNRDDPGADLNETQEKKQKKEKKRGRRFQGQAVGFIRRKTKKKEWKSINMQRGETTFYRDGMGGEGGAREEGARNAVKLEAFVRASPKKDAGRRVIEFKITNQLHESYKFILVPPGFPPMRHF